MEEPPLNCDDCGGADFYLDRGYYFCRQCGTQSQDTQEYVTDEPFDPNRSRTGVLKLQKKKELKSTTDKTAGRVFLSSWDILNMVLKAMTEKLIEIGFPELLRAKVFELWTRFLVNREVILVSKEEGEVVPDKFSLVDAKMNLRAIYNHDHYQTNVGVKRRAKKALEKELNPTNVVEESGSQAKRRKTIQKIKAFTEEFESSQRETQEDVAEDEVDYEEIFDVKKDEEVQEEEGSKKGRVEVTEKTKLIKKRIQNFNSFVNKSQAPVHDKGSVLSHPEKFGIRTIWCLLFVALRSIGCNVIIGDIISLFNDGTIYIESAYPLLNEELRKKSRNNADTLFISLCNPLSLNGIAKKLNNFSLILNYKYPYPRFEEILPKYIDDLCLPREFEYLVKNIYSSFPLEVNLEDFKGITWLESYGPMAEIWVVAHILLTLKMCFGLDDTTEKFQSNFARTVNSALRSIKSNKLKYSRTFGRKDSYFELFDIQEWFTYLQHRKLLVDHELFNPPLYHPNVTPNLLQVNEISFRYGGQREKMTSKGPYNPNANVASKKAQGFLTDLLSNLTNLNPFQDPIPSYVTANLPNEGVVEHFLEASPNVAHPNAKIEDTRRDFSQTRIDYIFNHNKYSPIFSKLGLKVKILRGDALNQVNRPTMSQKQIILFKPYKSFDDYLTSDSTNDPTRSQSMNFLLDIAIKMIIGTERDFGGGRKTLVELIQGLGDLYCRRCRVESVPLIDIYDK